jgi:hypothetical protein
MAYWTAATVGVLPRLDGTSPVVARQSSATAMKVFS